MHKKLVWLVIWSSMIYVLCVNRISYISVYTFSWAQFQKNLR